MNIDILHSVALFFAGLSCVVVIALLYNAIRKEYAKVRDRAIVATRDHNDAIIYNALLSWMSTKNAMLVNTSANIFRCYDLGICIHDFRKMPYGECTFEPSLRLTSSELTDFCYYLDKHRERIYQDNKMQAEIKENSDKCAIVARVLSGAIDNG